MIKYHIDNTNPGDYKYVLRLKDNGAVIAVMTKDSKVLIGSLTHRDGEKIMSKADAIRILKRKEKEDKPKEFSFDDWLSDL